MGTRALTQWFPTRWRARHLLMGAALLAGCQSAEARSGLTNTRGSAEDVAQAVLDAVAAKDRPALEALMVSEAEHRDLLFDQLPESHTWPFPFVRDLNMRNSMKGLGRTLKRYGGMQFELLAIEFTKDTEVYDGFALHRGAVLRVKRLSDGREGTLRILDVMVERNGRWKLMNYEE